MGPKLDFRSINFCEKIFFWPSRQKPTFSAKFLTFCRCASFPTKLSGKNPTFFVESMRYSALTAIGPNGNPELFDCSVALPDHSDPA